MRKTRMGQELISGLHEAIEHARGAKKLRSRSVELAEPAKVWNRKQIVWIRKKKFKVSQPVFASILSVTTSAVRAWEQGQKSPSGAARRLLEVAEAEPLILERIAHLAGKSR